MNSFCNFSTTEPVGLQSAGTRAEDVKVVSSNLRPDRSKQRGDLCRKLRSRD